jgi:hypothetical protein
VRSSRTATQRWLRAAALASVLSARALFAGSAGPALEIPYTAVAPKIDGVIDPVWAAAETEEFGVDIFNVSFRALHDGRTLYLLFHDLTDEAFGLASGATLFIEDEGGAPPKLWDDVIDASTCPAEHNRGEGRFDWFLASVSPATVQRRWTPLAESESCSVYVGENGEVAAMGFELGNGSRTEVALPLDGPSALAATTGEELGLLVQILYSETGTPIVVGTWPDGGASPAYFANAALAAFACGLPAEDFDPGFPLDWEVTGSGSFWKSSGTGGSECGLANQTGSTGHAACVVYDGTLESAGSNLVSPWFSLAEVTSATLSYRGGYTEATSSPGHLVLEITADGTTWAPVLDWTSSHGGVSGEAVSIDLLAHVTPGQPRVRLRWRFAGSNNVPAAAEIDDVRLTCGPFLFADGFESGLTTHWSAEAP